MLNKTFCEDTEERKKRKYCRKNKTILKKYFTKSKKTYQIKETKPYSRKSKLKQIKESKQKQNFKRRYVVKIRG